MSPSEPGQEPRLIDAMPRPVLAVFLLAGVVGLVAAVVTIVRPPTFDTVPVQERRPPPALPLTHDPSEVFEAPRPSERPAFDAPCAAVEGARPEGGTSFVRRITDALRLVCSVAAGGPDADLTTAARALDGVRIRVAGFERTGAESTADLDARVIYVNVKFTEKARPAAELVPILLHEAWHLAHPRRPVDAEDELAARRVEVAACREFILVANWPRWCEDAQALTTIPLEDALALLVSAGYRR